MESMGKKDLGSGLSFAMSSLGSETSEDVVVDLSCLEWCATSEMLSSRLCRTRVKAPAEGALAFRTPSPGLASQRTLLKAATSMTSCSMPKSPLARHTVGSHED